MQKSIFQTVNPFSFASRPIIKKLVVSLNMFRSAPLTAGSLIAVIGRLSGATCTFLQEQLLNWSI